MKDAKIYIAGHTGLVGTALFARYRKEGCKNIVAKTHMEIDLTRQNDFALRLSGADKRTLCNG